MDTNTIVLGDCTNKDLLKESSIDLTVTSPPYNLDKPYNSTEDLTPYEDYLLFLDNVLANIYTWTKPTGRLCLNIPLDTTKNGPTPIYKDILNIALVNDWLYNTTIVWDKVATNRKTSWGSWMSASAPYVIAPVEIMLVLYKDDWKRNTKGTSTIGRDEFLAYTQGLWRFTGQSTKTFNHPAPFPEDLPYRCIQLFSYKEDTILDPFSGSGTTAKVAQDLKRNFVGIEIDPTYHKTSIQRLEANTSLF